jgi:hypothetical protein
MKIQRQINVNGQLLNVELYHPYDNRPTIVFLHDSWAVLRSGAIFRDNWPMQCACLRQIGMANRWPSTYERPVNYMEREAAVK